ncbi:hypothetical protein CIPAW_07G012400 [Carya illinoinensis]|uniref:Pentatricopeptide repeat-containing protein n=1 Tax=Carya illinoinensis TaxID=32201 RepID=A0A8T1PXE1_CARIL|nr:hypothetical protein CIPAW_07G012400 [Carya illinoinensis]
MKHYNAILPLLDKGKMMTKFRQVHGLMNNTSVIKYVISLSRLIDFCANNKAGDFNFVESIFSQIEVPSAYIWNSIIKAYSNSNNLDEAMYIYKEMQFELDVYTSYSLLTMYVSCANMVARLKVFDAIPKWNVVAWTSLVFGYVNNGWPRKAIEVYKDNDMEFWDVEPNEITLVNVLVACSHSRDIDSGKWVQSRNFNMILATAIMDMDAKCGSLGYARKLFNKMPQKTLVGAYNQYGRVEEALCLFCMHGYAKEALSTFKRMQEDPNVIPNEIIYIGVLSTCSHLRLVEKGQRHFTSIADDYNIEPTVVVDLLIRASYFEEAKRGVKKMPTQQNHNQNGCDIYGNVNLADQLRSRITEMERRGSGVYVLLSNIYARVGKWQEAS